MKKMIVILGLSALLVVLTGCSILKEKPSYEVEKAEISKYLEEEYDLQIAEVDLWIEESDNSTHGTKKGDMLATVYDKRDPSLAIQVQKHAESGEFETTYIKEAFELRQEIFALLEKHKPGNPLNQFQGVYPESIYGVALISPGSTGMHLGVMRDKIDIDRELESNWALEQEVEAAIDRYIEKHPDSMDKEFHVSYRFYEKGNFDLDRYIRRHKEEGYYGIYEKIFGVTIDDHNIFLSELKEKDKPKIVFDYQVSMEERAQINNVEEYKKKAYEFWNKHYPNGFEFR